MTPELFAHLLKSIQNLLTLRDHLESVPLRNAFRVKVDLSYFLCDLTQQSIDLFDHLPEVIGNVGRYVNFRNIHGLRTMHIDIVFALQLTGMM